METIKIPKLKKRSALRIAAKNRKASSFKDKRTKRLKNPNRKNDL